MSGTLDSELLRSVVRDVLRDVLSARAPKAARSAPAAAEGDGVPVARVEAVAIEDDRDLERFVRHLLALFDCPARRAALRDGQYSFRLERRAARGDATPERAGGPQRIEAGVLSESKVIALARNGRHVVLGKRVAVTPLARDKARALGLKLERER